MEIPLYFSIVFFNDIFIFIFLPNDLPLLKEPSLKDSILESMSNNRNNLILFF